MLFDNINYLLRKRGSIPLSAEDYLALRPEDLFDLVSSLNYPFEILNTVNLESREDLLAKTDIRLVALDVDGVLTDGGLHYTSDGSNAKTFNVKDGMGITQAIRRGIHFAIVSASSHSEVVELRARILGIKHVHVVKEPKLQVLETILYSEGLGFDQVAYIGDDINDVDVLKKVGIGAVPADAVTEAKRAADVVLTTKGGHGCVREFLDTYLPE